MSLARITPPLPGESLPANAWPPTGEQGGQGEASGLRLTPLQNNSGECGERLKGCLRGHLWCSLITALKGAIRPRIVCCGRLSWGPTIRRSPNPR